MGTVSTFTTGNHSKPLMTDVDVIPKMINAYAFKPCSTR